MAGATAYQPGDGTNVADYLVAAGGLGADIHVLYCLACEGFLASGAALRHRVARWMVCRGCSRAASKRRPATARRRHGRGSHGTGGRGAAGVARRSSRRPGSSSIRVFARVSRSRPSARSPERGAGGRRCHTRAGGSAHRTASPDGDGLPGHFHAAAFRFRPLPKRRSISAKRSRLFEAEQLLGVLHLLNDDRRCRVRGKRVRPRRLLDRTDPTPGLTAGYWNHPYAAADRRVHHRADPVAARPRRVHQFPDLRVSRHHGRRIDHARRRRHGRADGRRRATRWSPPPRRSSRARWPAPPPACCTPGSRSTGFCPAFS